MEQDTTVLISNKYSEYISKLPGVINANVVFFGGEVEEIHVLADTSRSPKQIVRDIQSLLMAQFQKEVDHRVISIAQIDSELNPTVKQAARYVIDSVTVAKKREQTEVEVTLSMNGKMYFGKQTSLKDNYDVWRGLVQATLNAIVLADGTTNKYTVLDVRFTEIAGERMAIVCVSLSSINNTACRFSGTAFSPGDDSLAIVKATLSALNRKIGSC
ncbi:MAG: hypothetical protein CVU91_06680 [Firmicutes bacterium HGW-Firmicutes-16]|nr:MAG: hypothetical protein CVU91_06680 [Firmicutes bacterium HGW-Firmicutes-16]